jgi:hypothetical protein
MVSGGSLVEGGETQILSARVRRTIQSIKEIVGNHSESDIYAALKETNMDPNETAQKLLNQGGGFTLAFALFALILCFSALFWLMGFC